MVLVKPIFMKGLRKRQLSFKNSIALQEAILQYVTGFEHLEALTCILVVCFE